MSCRACCLFKFAKIKLIIMLVSFWLLLVLNLVIDWFRFFCNRLFIVGFRNYDFLWNLWLSLWFTLNLAWDAFRLNDFWLLLINVSLDNLGWFCFFNFWLDKNLAWFGLFYFWFDKYFTWLWLLTNRLTTNRGVSYFLHALLSFKWIITIFIFSYSRFNILGLRWNQLITCSDRYQALSNCIWRIKETFLWYHYRQAHITIDLVLSLLLKLRLFRLRLVWLVKLLIGLFKIKDDRRLLFDLVQLLISWFAMDANLVYMLGLSFWRSW